MAKLVVLFVVVALLGSALSAPSCNADFSIYTQPPNWPTGLNANLNINVNGINLANGWTIQFTAKGYGQNAPFIITSFWNTGNVTKQLNADNTATYTLSDAGYNKQSPANIGFLADTTLPHPRNTICGVTINGVSCSLSTSPAVFPPAVPSSAILLNYTVYNKNSTLPILVLIHGLTEDRRAWDPLLPLFTPHYRVLALDLRGHGLSQVTVGKEGYAPDSLASDVYRTIVAVFGASALPLIVGHSLGGTVATVYGHLFPVRGIIVVDQSMDLVQFQGLVKSLEPNLRADEPIFQGTMLAVFDQLYGALNQSERTRLDAIRSPRQGVVLGVWAVLLDLTPAQLIAYVDNLLQSPGGISELSLFGTPATGYAEWLNARIPGALVEVWLDLPTHYPHLAFPYRFAQRVRDFDAVATARLCK